MPSHVTDLTLIRLHQHQRVVVTASDARQALAPSAVILHEYPQLLQVDGFLDASECKHLIEQASKTGRRAAAVGVGGKDSEVRNIRKSQTSILDSTDGTVSSVRSRVAKLLSAPVRNLEAIQVRG